jgi:hypothetical protein
MQISVNLLNKPNENLPSSAFPLVYIHCSTFLCCILLRYAQASRSASPRQQTPPPFSLILFAVLFSRAISTLHQLRSRDPQVMQLSPGASLIRVQAQEASSPKREQTRPRDVVNWLRFMTLAARTRRTLMSLEDGKRAGKMRHAHESTPMRGTPMVGTSIRGTPTRGRRRGGGLRLTSGYDRILNKGRRISQGVHLKGLHLTGLHLMGFIFHRTCQVPRCV